MLDYSTFSIIFLFHEHVFMFNITITVCATSLCQDTAGMVKLWEITRGVVIENYGEVSDKFLNMVTCASLCL